MPDYPDGIMNLWAPGHLLLESPNRVLNGTMSITTLIVLDIRASPLKNPAGLLS